MEGVDLKRKGGPTDPPGGGGEWSGTQERACSAHAANPWAEAWDKGRAGGSRSAAGILNKSPLCLIQCTMEYVGYFFETDQYFAKNL